MADIFIAYTKDDCYFVNNLSKKIEGKEIEGKKISTWYYGRNKSLFEDPLRTSRCEIEKCHAFLMVVSDLITPNNFIDSELKWAKINHKPLVVILSNISEKDLERKFPDWAYILYTTTTCTKITKEEATDQFIEKLICSLNDSPNAEKDNNPQSGKGKTYQNSWLVDKLRRFYEYLITRNDRFYYILLLVLFTIFFVYSVTQIGQ